MRKAILHLVSPFFGLIMLLFLSLFSCHQITPEKATAEEDIAAINLEIHKIFEDFSKAYATLDADLVANLYMEDAFYLSGNDEITRGRSEIRKSFQRYFDWATRENATLNIDFDFHDEIYTKDMCSVIGYYLIVTDQQQQDSTAQRKSCGKFITVFQKDKDGLWKFISDGYNEAPVEAFKP